MARFDREAGIAALESALERTLDEDIAYGFRMLVDVAERSLSDSPFLDPTTAVQAIDRLHDGLRQLAVRELPDGDYHDRSGQLRLTVAEMNWNAYVHLAFDEIRIAGARSPQVTRRLMAALKDLHQIAPPERQPVLELQLKLLCDGVSEIDVVERDRTFALVPDVQGIGTAAGDGDTGRVESASGPSAVRRI